MKKISRNYLKMYRKKSGLNQKELAFLFGCASSTNVSRNERSNRKPTLQTVMGAQVVFGVSPEELFPGMYHEVEKLISHRAYLLSQKIKREKSTRITSYKLKLLRSITSGKDDEPGVSI